MGNKLGRRRHVVDEKYTRPQGLYQHKDVDHKKLRKLILDSKLAPCYPGDDDCSCDLEECPICFLYYPNQDVVQKGFVQMKTPNSTRPTQCPFCKTLNYAVEYRGVKTKEEKGQEQIEEQRVIEAKIRMRQQEILDEEERIIKRQETGSSNRVVEPREAEYFSRGAAASSSEGEEIVSASNPATIRHPARNRENRDDEFDLDPENIMLMEAIWLSFQEDNKHKHDNPNYGDATQLAKYATEVRLLASMAPQAEYSASSSSPSGGLACAIAALAERQQTGGESSTNYNNYGGNVSTYNVHANHSQTGLLSLDNHLQINHDNSETLGETAYGYNGNLRTTVDDDDVSRGQYGQLDEAENGGYGGSIVPESFEEQMMLAMAVSLAEARARSSGTQEVAWS
ncbi:hypothetical protein M8C21_009191 [Ambrosia artemisiifolia]|uniref:Uncharacterized protein n=1 Tax=Ambrosia artemisiifolia TaxID=4212 RepID=A0AAD5GSJ5_AMBAR|nr:hypothetical protein M8C21_009191 [Ambrosia artemisiifolia]